MSPSILRASAAFLSLVLSLAVARAQTFEVLFSDTRGHYPDYALIQGSDGNFYGTTTGGGVGERGTVFRMSPGGDVVLLHSLTAKQGYPKCKLVETTDGSFLGTTETGGSSNSGTVFRITPGGAFYIVHNFNFTHGGRPLGGLIRASDGFFYGTTKDGGNNNAGTVFKISAAGAYTVLHHFTSNAGSRPLGPPTEGTDGNFYGTTSAGGSANHGTAFKLTPAGGYTVLTHFTVHTGRKPNAELVQGTDGQFYGTTGGDPGTDEGTVFKLTASGSHTILHSFDFTNGRAPLAGLLQGNDGYFYGTTSAGGANNLGTIFKISPTGNHTLLHHCSVSFGFHPQAALTRDAEGSFYGTTSGGGPDGGFGTVFKLATNGAHSILHSFSIPSGTSPSSEMIKGTDGSLYGTTHAGGHHGAGTVFKINSESGHRVLYSFKEYFNQTISGSYPMGGLVECNDGNLYGTTFGGGSSSHGTIFRLTPDGNHTVLHSFTGANGRWPSNALVQGSDGSLYGTTAQGGTHNFGTLFRVTASGSFTLLHSFDGSDGNGPQDLIQGYDGSFYGATAGGGANGYGTLFKVTSNDTITLLHHFDRIRNGTNPSGKLVKGSDGSLYGTTKSGGAYSRGTIFKLSSGGTYTVLHSFEGHYGQGFPSGLIEGSDGSLYGTTPTGGASDTGTVFKITPGGVYTQLHSFDGISSAHPSATPTFGNDGNIYGTAQQMVIWRIRNDSTATLPPTLTSPASNTTSINPITVSFSLPEAALPGSVTISFGTKKLILAASQETAGPHSFSFDPANPTGSPEILSGNRIPDGTYSVTFSYQDAQGHPAASVTNNNVRIDAVVGNVAAMSTLHSKGNPVPSAGVSGSGITSGAVWSRLGIPTINDAGQIAVYGEWRAGFNRGAGVFRTGLAGTGMQVVFSSGSPISGLPGLLIGAIPEPLLAEDGSVACIVHLAGAPVPARSVTAADSSALLFDPDGPGSTPAIMIARKGTPAPGASGDTWSSFDSVALGQGALGFLARLTHNSDVDDTNDLGLWVYDRQTATTTLALREGQSLLGSILTNLSALTIRAAAGGQGRGVVSGGSEDQIAVRVTLANHQRAVGIVTASEGFTHSYRTFTAASSYGPRARWKSFGVPTQNTTGALTFLGTAEGGTATKANNVAIYTEDDSTLSLTRRVTKGSLAPGFASGVFAGFNDPVNGSGGAFAFAGRTSLNKGAGIHAGNNDGLWFHDGSKLTLIAREGDRPAGLPMGAKWKTFNSVALPEGGAPIFYATLVAGQGGVTTASDTGIWAMDGEGVLSKLIQEGDPFGSSTVRSFQALLPVSGSPAQTRSFNSHGEVVIQVTDATGGTHLLQVAIP
jgi:uncharacterized repeat protein (TIGR03803 family)